MAPARLSLLPPALLVLAVAAGGWRPARGQEAPQSPDWRMTLKTIRNGVHKIDTYLNAALDLLGGEDGLCQYKCSDGERGWRRDPCPGQTSPASSYICKYVYQPRQATSCTCVCV